jgi:hypothetical protein
MQPTTGWIVLATLITTLMSRGHLLTALVPTLLAWSANLLMWPTQSRSAKRQATLLTGLGCLALLFAALNGSWLGWQQVLAVNLPLIAMFVGLSFLGLANPNDEHSNYPKGRRAIVSTLLGTHLLGSVINLSVVFVFGDRLQRGGRLTEVQQTLVMRSFCAAAWWSPFFIATGVALTYAPGLQWHHTLGPGLLMATVALLFTCLEILRRDQHQFEGYPLRPEALALPLLLALAVLIAHFLVAKISILTLISLLAPIGGLLSMRGPRKTATFLGFIHNRLAGIGSQFALFLAAGVFSSGIKSVILLSPALFSFDGLTFGSLLFACISAAMIVVGLLGIHPVISIAVTAPLLAPLHPDPTRCGFLYLTVWAISTGSSPLSGIGLAMIGRYGASARSILAHNWYYAVVMWLTASLVDYLLLS